MLIMLTMLLKFTSVLEIALHTKKIDFHFIQKLLSFNQLLRIQKGLILLSRYVVLDYEFELVILSIPRLHLCFYNRCF